jgi:hypothetical protein
MTYQEYIAAQFRKAMPDALDVRVVLFPDQEMTCVIVVPQYRDDHDDESDPILFHMIAGSDDDEFRFVSATHPTVRFELGDDHPLPTK